MYVYGYPFCEYQQHDCIKNVLWDSVQVFVWEMFLMTTHNIHFLLEKKPNKTEVITTSSS